MNVCKERGIECDLATGLGFCSVTWCRKQNRVSNISIIPTLTVTDVPTVEYAPVVRCRDCKHLFDGEHNTNCCAVLMEKAKWVQEITVDDDFFCADGERR